MTSRANIREETAWFACFQVGKNLAEINSTLYVAVHGQRLEGMRICRLGSAGCDSPVEGSLNVASVCSVERSDARTTTKKGK